MNCSYIYAISIKNIVQFNVMSLLYNCVCIFHLPQMCKSSPPLVHLGLFIYLFTYSVTHSVKLMHHSHYSVSTYYNNERTINSNCLLNCTILIQGTITHIIYSFKKHFHVCLFFVIWLWEFFLTVWLLYWVLHVVTEQDSTVATV